MNKVLLMAVLCIIFGLVATLVDAAALLPSDLLPRTVLLPRAGDSLGVGGYTITGTILYIVLIIAGLLLCFEGRRLFRITLFIVGLLVVANLMYILLANVLPQDTGNRNAIILAVSLILGILAGGLLVCLWTIGVYIIGLLGGYALALFILSMKTGGVLDGAAKIVFIIVLMIIGLFLAHFFERLLIIGATAFIGAYMVMLGADGFAKTGFINAVKDILTGSTDYVLTPQVIAFIVASAILAIIGAFWQLRNSSK